MSDFHACVVPVSSKCSVAQSMTFSFRFGIGTDATHVAIFGDLHWSLIHHCRRQREHESRQIHGISTSGFHSQVVVLSSKHFVGLDSVFSLKFDTEITLFSPAHGNARQFPPVTLDTQQRPRRHWTSVLTHWFSVLHRITHEDKKWTIN